MKLKGPSLAAALLALAACQSGPKTVTTAEAKPQGSPPSAQAAATAYATPAQCTIALAGGPPPKPNRGADFGSAAAKNVGKGIGRSLISNIGASVAGPLGGAVASGLAANAIRAEHDLKGTWTATDGVQTCGCNLQISAATNLQLKTANSGRLSAQGCSNPLLAGAARWTLGHTFTGYDAPFQLINGSGATVASLKREGVDYFSGTLADGTPVTIWRD